jgi:hypothetical protein
MAALVLLSFCSFLRVILHCSHSACILTTPGHGPPGFGWGVAGLNACRPAVPSNSICSSELHFHFPLSHFHPPFSERLSEQQISAALAFTRSFFPILFPSISRLLYVEYCDNNLAYVSDLALPMSHVRLSSGCCNDSSLSQITASVTRPGLTHAEDFHSCRTLPLSCFRLLQLAHAFHLYVASVATRLSLLCPHSKCLRFRGSLPAMAEPLLISRLPFQLTLDSLTFSGGLSSLAVHPPSFYSLFYRILSSILPSLRLGFCPDSGPSLFLISSFLLLPPSPFCSPRLSLALPLIFSVFNASFDLHHTPLAQPKPLPSSIAPLLQSLPFVTVGPRFAASALYLATLAFLNPIYHPCQHRPVLSDALVTVGPVLSTPANNPGCSLQYPSSSHKIFNPPSQHRPFSAGGVAGAFLPLSFSRSPRCLAGGSGPEMLSWQPPRLRTHAGRLSASSTKRLRPTHFSPRSRHPPRRGQSWTRVPIPRAATPILPIFYVIFHSDHVLILNAILAHMWECYYMLLYNSIVYTTPYFSATPSLNFLITIVHHILTRIALLPYHPSSKSQIFGKGSITLLL